MNLQEHLPIILATLAIVILGGSISVLVVLKRLAFIGQGVSHAAFGGVGIALTLGFTGGSIAGNIGQTGVVIVFSIVAALWIAALSKRSAGGSDTAIGVVMAISMAVGFILVQLASQRYEAAHRGHNHGDESMSGHEDAHHTIEEVLFGSISDVGWTAAFIAMGVSALLLCAFWLFRRQLVFWAFDESVCPAFGVNRDRVRQCAYAMLAISVVLAMQLAGVVLASAIFVLPGATALNIGGRLRTVCINSTLLGIAAGILGLSIGIGLAWPIGPCIVAVQGCFYVISFGVRRGLR